MGKVWWQTDTVPHDSGTKTIQSNSVVNFILEQDSRGSHITISLSTPEEDADALHDT